MNGSHLFYMCPLCDKKCSYYLLSGNCMYAKATRYFDNEATIFFALFMSMWATLFLEFWKRDQICLAYVWNAVGFEKAEEQLRPEYIASNVETKLNPVTCKMEPHMPDKVKMKRLMGTYD